MPARFRANYACSRLAFRLLFWLNRLFLIALVVSGCSKSSEPVINPVQPTGETTQPLKISLSAPGVARIPRSELSLGMQSALDEPEKMHLYFRGVSIPFWVETQGEALTFYVQGSDSLYTQESVYLLSVGELYPQTASTPAVLPISPPTIPSNLPPASYFAQQRLEQNLLYLPQAEGDERWFWQALVAPASQDIEIQVSDLALNTEENASARLNLALWSASESAQAPDHHLRVLINGQLIADEKWDGKGRRLLQANFNPQILSEGVNHIVLEAPGDTGVAADLSYVDWLEIGFPRRLRPQNDRLEFWSQGGALTLEGFSGAVFALDTTHPLAPEPIVVEEKDGLVKLDTQAGRRYLVVGAGGYQKPASLLPLASLPDLRAPDAGADYVAVGAADLLQALQPLLDYRSSEGLRVMAVPLDAVYDQFNFGIPEPQAIQHWMRYAAENWQPAPRFLLLVGDATYDPKGYLTPEEANRLPTFLVDTVYGGQTASDVAFVELDGDDRPDLAVGRLPARTPDQAATYAAKTLAYERDLAMERHPYRILAVADGQEPGFQRDARAWLELFPPPAQTELLAPSPGESEVASSIQKAIREGTSFVAYFGHGSVNMWGKDQLFTAEEAARLDNLDRLPVVLNMTCLTGLFTHPKVESLAEALLFNPNGGAAAVLAPSSLTLAYDQSFLSEPLVKEILAQPEARLGEIHLAARRQINLDTPGKRDVMLTFMLFGDPAIHLPPLNQ